MSDTTPTPGAEPTPEPTPEPATSSTPPASTPPASTPPASTSADAVATLKTADPLDLGTIGAGVLVFLGSLLPYYTVSVEGFGSESATAWHGFLGWFGALAALAGAGVLVARILGAALPVPVRTTVLALFGIAAFCTLLALFVTPGGDCDDSGLMGGVCDMIDQGHGFGYWLALLASIAGLVLAAVRRAAD
ncbi:hypothetical protein SAMN05192575_10745 [Nocardioides alpinus]|uniref:Uncharacterized protein n=1 Tax=Nocardioides alpinus TaxID=748909 RepID=A0A1I0ZYD2_9ACTN|nr:hypothetical protein [Nocardioides alpinus]PKH42246.1 hypothetical protein CXG46_07195 [Nocardioides alpinus]SFB30785.1 hypothetical protein SAMN05192575_10745 [Nocardioides alpinus]